MNNFLDENPQKINPTNSEVVRLVQITDCHIFAAQEERLMGLNTRKSLMAVCTAAIDNSANLDLILVTGDLSQDGSAASYQHLAKQFESLEIATFWLPGNHDDNTNLQKHFRGKNLSAAKQVLIGNWQIVLLDSTIRNEVHGCLTAAQLEFLGRSLQSWPDKHTLVCLHHQALAMGSEWLDKKGLKNSAQFRAVLTQHENVKAVLWGHVHQDSRRTINQIEWLSTPSSCVQFKPGSKDFAVGNEPPGYRQLILYPNGKIESEVHRVDGIEFDTDCL